MGVDLGLIIRRITGNTQRRVRATGFRAVDERNVLHVLESRILFQERADTSTPGRTIRGLALKATAETDAGWFIWVEDQVGTLFHRQYALVSSVQIADFVHKWSEIDINLPDIQFLNQFSLQTGGSVNQYGLVAHTTDLNFGPSDGFSILIDTKNENGAGIFAHKMDGANNGWRFDQDASGRVLFEFRGSGTGDRIRVRTDSLVAPVNNGAWHQILVTKASGSFAASSVNIFVDNNDEVLNVLTDNLGGASPTDTNTDPMGFAATNSGGTRLAGNCDELTVFNAQLSAANAAEIWNSNIGAIDLENAAAAIADSLVSWWRFGDGSFLPLGFPDIPDEISGHDMTLQAAMVLGDIESEVRP